MSAACRYGHGLIDVLSDRKLRFSWYSTADRRGQPSDTVLLKRRLVPCQLPLDKRQPRPPPHPITPPAPPPLPIEDIWYKTQLQS